MIDTKKIDAAIEYALGKISSNIPEFTELFPEEQSRNYIYRPRKICSWTESFWTGMLWLAYELTKDKKYAQTAQIQLGQFRERIETRTNIDTHDLGFLYTLSAVAEYKLTGSEEAKRVALLAADTLTERYKPKGGFIQAWGKLDDPSNYRLIIDCLLNLPLLYWASGTSGNKKYYNVAYQHLKTSIETVVREDGSTFHTVFFDPKTGEKTEGKTHQGYSDDSCWARGQAWGIYGLALSYKYTKDDNIIGVYKKITDYFIAHLPEDYIPYWDLIFTEGDEPRDTSAASIAICGILEMDKNIKEPKYLEYAEKMLNSLIDNYTTKNIPNSNGLLTDGMYNRPRGDNPESTIWGDYYYLEALMRFKNPDWKMYW